ncbi:ROK family transcriptional regulator [Nakamurella alba]|uniref:ROK family transcriptional regulator n=1 Tax=Nakamurella alba TaxID=2665158 RepID=UPI002AC353C7|nr:ROK family protein [Nakamurella alba]
MTGGEGAVRALRTGGATPARQAQLREHNLGIVLGEILHSPGPISRADISGRTGLTRTTVSALVDQLLQAGMVAELPVVRSRTAGRPAVPLIPATGTIAAVGLEVNVDYLGVRVLDLAGEVIAERVVPGDHRRREPAEVLGALADLFAATVYPLSKREIPLAGACVALPGLIDSGTGPLRIAPNLHWSGVDVVALLAGQPALHDVPIRIANEATLGAQAENAALRGADVQSFLYVSGEIGIGGAIVLDRRLWAGSRGWGGEIGHTTVDPTGPECGCGSTGCLEMFAGKDALMSAAGLDRDLPVDALVAAATAGRKAATRAIEDAGRALGIALSGALNLLDVDTVVLGGLYAPLTDLLVPAVQEQLSRRVLAHPFAPVTIRPAVVTDHAALTGAARSVLDEVLADPSTWISRAG